MRPPFVAHLFIACAILFLLTRCQHVTPQPPKAEGFDPPIPAERSYLAGSITLPLSQLQAKINAELDPVLVGKGSEKGGKKSMLPFSVIRSGPVQLQYVDQQIRFSAPLQVQLTKLLGSTANTPKAKPFCAIHIDFKSPLTLMPTWRLASHVKFVDYRWEIKPQIKLLGKAIPLTRFAERIIQKYQSAIEAAIDSAVYKDLRLDKMAAPIWRSVQKPLVLNKQYGLWLLPKPVGVTASPISGDRQKITVPLLITLNPQTEVNARQPVYPLNGLPVLQKRDTVPPTSDLRVMNFVPYTAINRIAAQTLHAKPLKLALGRLTINRVTVYGGQRTVIVKTDVSGLVAGTLYLRGRPDFDTTTNTLRINNLDFDAQTQGALSSLSSRILHNGLRVVLEDLLSVSLGEEISQLPQKIDAAFEKSSAGKRTNLSIRAFRLIPLRVAVRPDGIQALIKVQSKVGLQVQHL